jgi:hypothetical protein
MEEEEPFNETMKILKLQKCMKASSSPKKAEKENADSPIVF